MKIQVRKSVFETNSSSTHSLTMCMNSDFKKWKNEEIIFDDYEYKDGKFISYEEAKIKANERYYNEENLDCTEMCDEGFKKFLNENLDLELYPSWDNFVNYKAESYEIFEENFTTPNGDEVVSFGYQGMDY